MRKGTSHGSDARCRIQTASADTFSSESHYQLVCRHIRAGDAVHPSDHRFYRRYCRRNGLEPLEARASASVPRISLSESSEERYVALVATLKNGGYIGPGDYAFLRRYCKGSELPRCRAVYVLVED